MSYDPELIDRLVREAREWRDVLVLPHPPHLDTAEKRAREIDRLGALSGMVERFGAMADQLEAARREVEQYRADLAIAAGMCLVPIDEMSPGSHLRRVVMANRMWRYERDRMQLVVDAALASYGSQRGGHFGQPRPTDAMLELAAAIDAYRAAKGKT